MIRRSGIEVAMHAEADAHVVFVAEAAPAGVKRSCYRIAGCRRWRYPDRDQVVWRRHRTQLLVHDVNADVEVLAHVPLGARTDPPGLPVHVAAGSGNRQRTNATTNG